MTGRQLEPLAWIGSALVLLGRYFLALDGEWRLAGWAVSGVGDVCWVAFGWRNRLYAIVWLDVVLFVCDTWGLVRTHGG